MVNLKQSDFELAIDTELGNVGPFHGFERGSLEPSGAAGFGYSFWSSDNASKLISSWTP